MKSKVYSTLITLAATAVPPYGMLVYWIMNTFNQEALTIHDFLFIFIWFLPTHVVIWLFFIPAFRRFPRTSWILCTLLYPLICFCGMLAVRDLIGGMINPFALIGGMIVLGPTIYIEAGWASIPVSGISATIAFVLTRINPVTDITNRGIAAPAS